MSKAIPRYDDLFKPTLDVLAEKGGSATVDEIEDALIAALGITQEQLDVVYPKSGTPILPDRMSWARSYLKTAGLVENPRRGVWVLTEAGRSAGAWPNDKIKQEVNAAYRAELAQKKQQPTAEAEEALAEEEGTWATKLLQAMQAMSAAAPWSSASFCRPLPAPPQGLMSAQAAPAYAGGVNISLIAPTKAASSASSSVRPRSKA